MSGSDDRSFRERLVASGLKSTKCRIAILDVLEKSVQPLTVDDVFFAMKQQGVDSNLSTVYRSLKALSEKGLVTKISIANDSRTFFEYNRMIHRHHLICLGCKSIFAIDNCPLTGYEETLAQATGYNIVGHDLVMYGYCPDCQRRGGE